MKRKGFSLLTLLSLLLVASVALSGCMPAYGYGVRPGYYRRGYAYYPAPVYRTPGWGHGGYYYVH